MTHYTREIKAPANKAEGLQNFVQMIINTIEAGNTQNALLMAVDLLQDLESGIYQEVNAPDMSEAMVPMSEHLRAVEAARIKASNDALRAGQNAVKAELRRLLEGAI